MEITENISLATLTTLKVGGVARYVVECQSSADIAGALEFAKEKNLPWYVLGQGSNVLAQEHDVEAIIVQLKTKDILWDEESEREGVLVIADAGVSWDTLVEESVKRSLWGIENLAGIPGTVGAAPVQNIGAYGAELSDTLVWVEVYDTKKQTYMRLMKEECSFGYRESAFKHDSTHVITKVALSLSYRENPRIDYVDLACAVEQGAKLVSPLAIASSVRDIRARKFPDMETTGTAGSFFKNPVVTEEAFSKLKETYKDLPGFPFGNGVKIPLAYILDKVLSMKGFSIGPVALYQNQPLVLVTHVGATVQDVETLAQEVAQKVIEVTGLSIEREVRTLRV
jgi:UDP-N-acetylmuramate dehydrogenase